MAKKITTEAAMQELAKRKHIVDPGKASAMVKKFKTFRTKLATAKKNGEAVKGTIPELPICITYNKKAIQALLKSSDAEGLRIYPAINEENAMTFVMVAVNANGETLQPTAGSLGKPGGGGTVDEGQQCPPYPASGL